MNQSYMDHGQDLVSATMTFYWFMKPYDDLLNNLNVRYHFLKYYSCMPYDSTTLVYSLIKEFASHAVSAFFELNFAWASRNKQCIHDTGSSVDDHLLASYMAAAVVIVQVQFTQRRFEDGMQARCRIFDLNLSR